MTESEPGHEHRRESPSPGSPRRSPTPDGRAGAASSTNAGNSLTQRQVWIDVLKGIGIVAVVVGHVSSNDQVIAQIFLFHMPLFFLVGGWLHNPSTPPRPFLKAKARSLLLPYLAFLLILWPLELLRTDTPWSWDELAVPMLLGGRWLTGAARAMWFVTCYFLTQQLVHFLLRRLTPPQCAGVAVAMLSCAYMAGRLWPGWALPWAADVVLFAAPLYLIGYAARRVELDRWTALWAVSALGAVGLNLAGYANTIDMKYSDYGLPLITLASALAVVATLAVLARRVAGSVLGRVLAALGGASMTIMFLHQLVQRAIADQLGIMHDVPRIAGALAVCYLVHVLLSGWPAGALLFLGRRPQPVVVATAPPAARLPRADE